MHVESQLQETDEKVVEFQGKTAPKGAIDPELVAKQEAEKADLQVADESRFHGFKACGAARPRMESHCARKWSRGFYVRWRTAQQSWNRIDYGCGNKQ